MDAQEFLSPPEIPIAGASKDHTASLFENSNLFSTQATPKSPLAGNIEEVIIFIIKMIILSVRVKRLDDDICRFTRVSRSASSRCDV